MSSDRVTTAVAAYRAAAAGLAELDCDPFTHPELLDLLNELETVAWQLPTVEHRIIARLQREASPVELGAKSLKAVLTQRLRISGKDAARRLAEAKDLGPRTALNGEPLAPLLAQTAAAQANGTIGPEHVEEIRTFFGQAARLGGPGASGTCRRPRWCASPAAPGPRNSARPPPSWPPRSIRTAPNPTTPNAPANAPSPSARNRPTG